jgi:nucleotide-binding universal stress UspA family protein
MTVQQGDDPESDEYPGAQGQASAGRTLAWAMREALASRADLVVVRAGVSAPTLTGLVRGTGSLPDLELADAGLARAVAAARLLLGEDRVRVVIDRDPPADVLVRTAGPGDLLVVGAPARSGWWSRASTTYAVISRARCPVVVVPNPVPAGDVPARARGVAEPVEPALAPVTP